MLHTFLGVQKERGKQTQSHCLLGTLAFLDITFREGGRMHETLSSEKTFSASIP